MSLLILRPLIWGLIEYILAFIVYKKGKFMPKTTAIFLIFLGSYQIGEFLLFTDGSPFWARFALFSTTMLPPFGLMLIQGLSKQKTFYILSFIASGIFGALFLFVPSMTPATTECNCFTKYDDSTLTGIYSTLYTTWQYYYVGTLTLSCLIAGYCIYKKQGDVLNLKRLLVGYASFFPFSYVVTKFTTADPQMVASIMCSLAIGMAIVTSYVSIYKKFASDEAIDSTLAIK